MLLYMGGVRVWYGAGRTDATETRIESRDLSPIDVIDIDWY